MNKLPRKLHPTLLTSSLIILFFCAPYSLYAQNFEQGLNYYKAQKYKRAIPIFKNLSAPRADLFLGKSLYALGRYRQSLDALDNISGNSLAQLYMEATYTTALVNFQRKKFGKALNELYDVAHSSMAEGLTSSAGKLYNQILDYLTANQREKIIKGHFKDAIKFDLLKSSMGKIPYQKARNLYRAFNKNVENGPWAKQLKEIHSTLKSANRYGSSDERLQPPKGTIYHIGIALPRYKPDSRNYAVVRGLYLGTVLAADQYNREHQRTKILIHFVNTGGSENTMKTAVTQFVSKDYGDVLIGPLFSQQLRPMLSVTSTLRLPAIAPLANKAIPLKNSWLYQANPTYGVQGKEMAKFAVNTLNLNRFTILADLHSRGAVAARAFKKEAVKLGASINHYFVKNMSSEYEFSKYTRYFGASPTPINAIYAPLNGSNALTLIDLLLRKLRTVPHHFTVMGAQEWANYHFNNSGNDNLSIYYTETDQQAKGSRLNRFKRKYRQKFKSAGNAYAVIGYDITTFILKALHHAGNPGLLRKSIANQDRYNGVTRDIYFGKNHVNQAISIVQAPGS